MSDADLAAVLDRISDWVLHCDHSGQVECLNRSARLGLGAASQQHLSLVDLVVPELRHRARIFFQTAPPASCDLTVITGDGRRIELECRSTESRAGREVIARDVTPVRRLEEQLEQAQKREAIGILAGGIAHDFNNLLTGIVGYADLLKLEAKPGEHLHEALSVIQKAAEQAVQLTTQLLNYARRGKQEYKSVDAHATVREVIGLLRRTIDKQITVETAFQAPAHHILGDSGQLHQVLLNLALNAKDAMPRGGRLLFRTELRVPTLDMPLESIPHLVIEVTDDGAGIPIELHERIFEPFFTTKEPGRGTGMGLAMVNGIVKSHGGLVRLKSALGLGTTFTLYLPLAPEPAKRLSDARAALAAGRGMVLLVDDEEIVRQVGTRMLQGLGYQVVTLKDGAEAVRHFAQHWREIDLVILDMVMPSLGGRDCYMALRLVNPDVRVILTSGYGQDSGAQELIELGVAGFIQKPYQLTALAEVVNRALPQPQSVPIR